MKNRFLLCIRPVVTEGEDGERRYVTTVSTKRSNRARMRSPKGLTVSGRESSRRQEEPVSGSHKTLSQAIKAVLFEVTLRRSVRERNNIIQQTPRSNSNSSRKNSTHFDRSHGDGSVNRKPHQTQPEIHQHQPISPKPSTSPSNSLNPKKQSISGGANHNDVSCSTYAMCFFVISLSATIFWGKIFGVLCASMWLYMVPRRGGDHSGGRRSVKSGKLPETEEEMVEYKKRVIMEGLLERNHRRDHRGQLNLFLT